MKYQLLISNDANDLTRQIEELMKQDWRPQGGIAVVPGVPPDAVKDQGIEYWGPSCFYYMQAMTLPFGFSVEAEKA